MAFFEGWPYTNFHDMNLDWVIETCRKIHVELHQLHHELHRAINCEEQARIDADIALGQRIDQEIQDRTDADNALGARIDQEIQDRTAADNALGGRIDQEITDRTAADQAELEARTEADNALSARIDKEVQDRTAADQQLQENINQEITDRQEAVSAESAARQAADQQLQTAIDKEISDRTQAVTAEAEARAAADTALGQRIDQEITDRTEAVTAEAEARAAADTALGQRIDQEITNRTEADSALSDRIDQEITDRTAADAANTQAIAAEAAARADADTHIQDDLSHEITNRQDADTALGQRIDDLQPQLIPAGGTQGQVLAKTTGDNYAVAWTDPGAAINGLPEGGTDGQILQKSGSDNFAAKWVDATAGPEGPQGPQGERGPQGPQGDPGVGVPTGGTAGQVLAKVDGTDYNTHWVDQTGGGSDPNAIKKDGTTETTAAIPFALGVKTLSVSSIDGRSPVAIESELDLNSHKITGISDGSAASDAVNYQQMTSGDSNSISQANSYTDSQLEAAMADVHSVPAGGSMGQVLAKVDGTNYNAQWINPPTNFIKSWNLASDGSSGVNTTADLYLYKNGEQYAMLVGISSNVITVNSENLTQFGGVYIGQATTVPIKLPDGLGIGQINIPFKFNYDPVIRKMVIYTLLCDNSENTIAINFTGVSNEKSSFIGFAPGYTIVPVPVNYNP